MHLMLYTFAYSTGSGCFTSADFVTFSNLATHFISGSKLSDALRHKNLFGIGVNKSLLNQKVSHPVSTFTVAEIVSLCSCTESGVPTTFLPFFFPFNKLGSLNFVCIGYDYALEVDCHLVAGCGL